MPSSTDSRRRRRAAVLAALGAVTATAALVLPALWSFGAAGGWHTPAAWTMALVALLGLAVAAWVLAALGQRLKELKGGEEDDARQY